VGRDPVAECFRNRNSRNGSYINICFRGWRNENRDFVWSCVLHPDAGSWPPSCAVTIPSSVLISSLCKGKCCSASSTLSPPPWWFNVFSVRRHVDDRLFRCRLSSKRLLPRSAVSRRSAMTHVAPICLPGLAIVSTPPEYCQEAASFLVRAGRSSKFAELPPIPFDRLAIPRTSLPARLCLCRCGGSPVNSPMTCVYRLDMSSFEYSHV